MKILIVEDNEALAQTTGWIVEMLGHAYHICLTPEAALAQVTAYQPQAVIMDIGLPGMSGHDLCRRMRALPACADTAFIAQTGWDDPESRARSREAGFAHHLTKPVDVTKLESVLNLITAGVPARG